MKFGVLVCILFVVQPLSHIFCCGSCRNNEEYVDVKVKLKTLTLDENTNVILKEIDSNDSTSVVCNVFHTDVAANFRVVDNPDGICKEIDKLLLFKDEKEDLDGKKRTSYLAFHMENFHRLGENMHDCMKMVEFGKIKLFIEDEGGQSAFILNTECYDAFQALLKDNKSKLFKNIKDNADNDHLSICEFGGHKHNHVAVKLFADGGTITLKIPKSLLEKK